ncbi:MAG: recombinase family protein [Clostridia bacterium]
MAKKIRKIEQIAAVFPQKPRVAAYARVSSGKDAMLHSLSAQISYYSKLIQENSNWEFAGIYTDSALTGTKDTRPEFQRLLTDCRDGKVDMVITKSISRFARNTVTLLETTRELKALGVNVYFEEQNLYTISGEGEMILTLLASVAQEESRATSDNCKWRIRHQFQNGELANFRFMFGYSIKKGMVSVNEGEAAIVRSIFSDYLSGMGCGLISKRLREMNAPSLRDGLWSPKRVCDILQNEKYAGNTLLQKKYITDHLTKKAVRNRGSLPQYFAEETHPAIISRADYDRAMAIMASNRKKCRAGTKPRQTYPFTGKITCGQCGKHYRRKVTATRAVWICATFNNYGKDACASKQIPEDTLYALTAEVLGLDTFNEEAFYEKIEFITVSGTNQITYIFTDGQERTASWQDRSRRESWTSEMRQQARERALQQRRNA